MIVMVMDSESSAHEAAESDYTKKREGEFTGQLPGAFDSCNQLWNKRDNQSMKKQRDPAETKEGE